ncbi:ImmA/IrrE family metallo-endopeptidase [Ruminococcaceae bacterium OttesenSCG-928-I18]|nr:ImmA/IrrE family metallo-endopeptidase [Ruminococcaceae bacterium OttesenSCG-928-I18]
MSEIIAHAERITSQYGTRDPFVVAHQEGITVVEQPLLEMRGMYTKIRDFPFIFLADDLPWHVRFFVCSHELGHHFRHQGLNRAFMDSRTFMEPGRYENSADKFALHFWLGGAPMYRDLELTYVEMAECLNVDTHNVDARLLELSFYH